MVIHWSEDHVEFFDITHDGKSWHLYRIQHCECCEGEVWRIEGDPEDARFLTIEGATTCIKEELRDGVHA